MSGIALLWNLDGAPADREQFFRVLGELDHRGVDGRNVRFGGGFGLGHQHFWTTPEEWGETQPLRHQDAGLVGAFDGRIDNREEILSALGIRPAERHSHSDAQLFLGAFVRWGERAVARLYGSFVAAVVDERRQRAVIARDPLGGKAIYYYVGSRFLLAASEPGALLAHRGVPRDIDERTVAEFFAVRAPEDGRTFFAAVRELPPGQVLTVDPQGYRLRRYWHFDPPEPLRLRRDEEYAERFRELLAGGVKACLRASAPPGVMMSGGLDSTSAAALAASHLTRTGQRLTTFSWVFDELVECDERAYIDAFTTMHGTQSVYVPGDDAWPLRHPATWPVCVGSPWQNPYRRLKERVYQAARDRGRRILITGAGSDHFYTGTERWLVDLVRELRFGRAAIGLLADARLHHGWRLWRIPGLRAFGTGLLDALPGARRLRPRHSKAPPTWLTPYAASLLQAADSPPGCGRAQRPLQCRRLFDALAAANRSGEDPWSSRFAIEVRDPYQDRAVVEFMLAVPAHQLYSAGFYKPMVRRGMAGLLPGNILQRSGPTSLFPLFNRGLLEREAMVLQRICSPRGASWRRYVRSDWLETEGIENLKQFRDGPGALVMWQTACFELWRDSLAGRRTPAPPRAIAAADGGPYGKCRKVEVGLGEQGHTRTGLM